MKFRLKFNKHAIYRINRELPYNDIEYLRIMSTTYENRIKYDRRNNSTIKIYRCIIGNITGWKTKRVDFYEKDFIDYIKTGSLKPIEISKIDFAKLALLGFFNEDIEVDAGWI